MSGDNDDCQGLSIFTLNKPWGLPGAGCVGQAGLCPASWASGRERSETERQALVVEGTLTSPADEQQELDSERCFGCGSRGGLLEKLACKDEPPRALPRPSSAPLPHTLPLPSTVSHPPLSCESRRRPRGAHATT